MTDRSKWQLYVDSMDPTLAFECEQIAPCLRDIGKDKYTVYTRVDPYDATCYSSPKPGWISASHRAIFLAERDNQNRLRSDLEADGMKFCLDCTHRTVKTETMEEILMDAIRVATTTYCCHKAGDCPAFPMRAVDSAPLTPVVKHEHLENVKQRTIPIKRIADRPNTTDDAW